MNAKMFDVSPDGVLVVMDAAIGALSNQKKLVQVEVNATLNQLELSVRGRVEQTFRLDKNVWYACLDAFKAYLTKVKKMSSDDPAS
jgi:hypothetical protein